MYTLQLISHLNKKWCVKISYFFVSKTDINMPKTLTSMKMHMKCLFNHRNTFIRLPFQAFFLIKSSNWILHSETLTYHDYTHFFCQTRILNRITQFDFIAGHSVCSSCSKFFTVTFELSDLFLSLLFHRSRSLREFQHVILF